MCDWDATSRKTGSGALRVKSGVPSMAAMRAVTFEQF